MIQFNENNSIYIDEENDTYYCLIKGEKINSIQDFYIEISKSLSIPAYFGQNLDALEEVIHDLNWIENKQVFLIIQNAESIENNLEDDYYEIIDILNDCENSKLKTILIA